MKKTKSDVKKTQKQDVRNATLVSFMATLTLFLIKIIAAYSINSSALRSDAFNSLSDFFATFISYIGLTISTHSPTERFKYGFYKAEHLTSAVISGLILYIGISSIIGGITDISTIPEILVPLIGIFTAIVSIVLSALMSLYLIKIGKRINSPTLKAAGTERKSDIFISSLVLIAIVCSYFKIRFIEGIVTIIVSLAVVYMGFNILKDSIYGLLDISPEPELEKSVLEYLNEFKRVQSFRDLRLRRSGAVIFGEVKTEISKSLDLQRTHEILTEIEISVQNKFPQIISLTMHPEPAEAVIVKVLIPIENPRLKLEDNTDSEFAISEHFGHAKGFMLIQVNRKTKTHEIIDVFENPYLEKKVRAGLILGKYLMQEKQFNVLLTKSIGEISFNLFRENVLELYSIDNDMVFDEVMKSFKANDLPVLSTYTTSKDS